MDWVFDMFDSAVGLGILAVIVSIASVVVRMILGRVVGGLFGSLSRFALDKPFSAATLTSTPTNGSITLRQILNGQLGHPSVSEPAERIKVLEELHAQGGISADKLAKLKAAIAAGD
jgi:hypothetical protein